MDYDFKQEAPRTSIMFSEGLKAVLRGTATALITGALVGGLWIGSAVHDSEKKKSNLQPLGFSEITQIERDAEKAGIALGPIMRYLTSTSDCLMKILECRITANSEAYQKALTEAKETDAKKRIKEVKMFAQELQIRRDPKFAALQRHHYELRNLLPAIPQQADAALKQLDDFSEFMGYIHTVNNKFADTWDEDHDNKYRTEIYIDFQTTTDSEGNSTTTPVVSTRPVYDHTDHTYVFNKSMGDWASQDLDRLLIRFPSLDIKEKILTTSKINSGGKMAAQKSRMNQKDVPATEAEFFAIANTWYDGSTIKANLPDIKSYLNQLKSGADRWREAKETARPRYSYETNSSSDAGPYEYRVAKANLLAGQGAYKLIEEIISSIAYTKQNIPVLDKMILELIDIEMNGKKGNSKKLYREITKLTFDIYNKNTKKGFDLHDYSEASVILFGLLGALGGGLIGLGVNKGIKKITGYEDY
ncbi:hypothetical protein JW756_04685 [Candidatus Woesearchaeota archaeon]|nr:hypothetical protein [Candidatus Woesearchaeota archaeon]